MGGDRRFITTAVPSQCIRLKSGRCCHDRLSRLLPTEEQGSVCPFGFIESHRGNQCEMKDRKKDRKKEREIDAVSVTEKVVRRKEGKPFQK